MFDVTWCESVLLLLVSSNPLTLFSGEYDWNIKDIQISLFSTPGDFFKTAVYMHFSLILPYHYVVY